MVHKASRDIEGANSSVPNGMHGGDVDLLHHSTDKDPGPIRAAIVWNVKLIGAVDHLPSRHGMGDMKG